MKEDVSRWQRDWKLMGLFFSRPEISLISDRLNTMKVRNVVFCSFENRFAKSGGLASVILNSPPFIKEINAIPAVLLMSPFYPALMPESKLKKTGKYFSLRFANKDIDVEILQSSHGYSAPQRGAVQEYYLKCPSFFQAAEGVRDPYCYHTSDTRKSNTLLSTNSLFFCKAVPQALSALGITEDVVCHLHEWQTAMLSLTVKEAMTRGVLHACGTVQTIHNSYDAQFSRRALARLVEKERRSRLSRLPAGGLSAYQVGLQLVDAPITTVSSNFARELSTDILQTRHFVPHLQRILKSHPPVGINNGMFVDYSPSFPKREQHTLDEIRSIKLRNRQALLKILSTYRPKDRFGIMTYRGKSIMRLPEDVPIFVMTGRLDPLQKGYSVLLRAIENFRQDAIKVVLAPLPVRTSDLDHFYDMARRCEGNVTVFPFRMQRGYHELQAGSTFGIMPSVYEPFGAAVEYMAHGTVTIARATGGLVDQIDRKCGILYRESSAFLTLKNVTSFVHSGMSMQMRTTNPWIQQMTESLTEAMEKAADLYQNHPRRYCRFILNGFRKARKFSWTSNAQKYFKIYQTIGKT